MPKIPNLLAFGKHCHHCGKWMPRRALRKHMACNFCQGKIFARNCMFMQLCSRCVECDSIILDNFNYCESCGLETNRQIRLNKARELSNRFTKNPPAPEPSNTVAESQDLFEEFQVDHDELIRIDESLVTDDNSSEKENGDKSLVNNISSDQDNEVEQLHESVLTDAAIEEKKKDGWQATKDK